jgi:hypothetical protein
MAASTHDQFEGADRDVGDRAERAARDARFADERFRV